MQCPALGGVPGSNHDLTIKATATGITFLHERRLKSRYTGSKTCAIGINGEIWPRKDDYLKMQALKIPSRLISYSVDGLHYLHKENYIQQTTPKRKKKAAVPSCLKLFDVEGVTLEPAISAENSDLENISPTLLEKTTKKLREKSYSVNKKECRQRLLTYVNTQKGQKELYFWTVTFPAGTSDDVCYQAFNTWLTTLRTRRKDNSGRFKPAVLRDYIWVAERQLGEHLENGKAPTNTIHFHIGIPHYMSVTYANAAMRGILRHLAKKGLCPGAVCNSKTKEQYYLPCISKYNGVHISRNKQGQIINFAIKRASRYLAGYLTKYITKNDAGVADKDGNVAIPGFPRLAWHNSRGFSRLFTAVAFTVEEFTRFGFRPLLNKMRQFHMEFATFIPWLYGPPRVLMDHLFQLNSYIQILFDGKTTQTVRPS